MDNNIPEEVVNFIYKNIELYQDLETILLIFKNQEEYYSDDDLAKTLNITIYSAKQSLVRLFLKNLIHKKKSSSEFYYTYNPSNKQNNEIIELLYRLNETDKIELMILILLQPLGENCSLTYNLIRENIISFNTIKDEDFDQVYPDYIKQFSDIHWTPAEVAIKAAKLLVGNPGTKVLDIGSGVGKFCILGSLTTHGYFTGVEFKESIADLSKRIINQFNIENAEIINSNITNIDFSKYDAFYFFNSFYENIFIEEALTDPSVELSPIFINNIGLFFIISLKN